MNRVSIHRVSIRKADRLRTAFVPALAGGFASGGASDGASHSMHYLVTGGGHYITSDGSYYTVR